MHTTEKNIDHYIIVFIAMLYFFLFMLHGAANSLTQQVYLEEKQVPVIVLDAGHGGEDSGAIGITGIKEKEINLSIAQTVQKLLTLHGMEVIMTRSNDNDLADATLQTIRERKVSDLKNRVDTVENNAPCTLVSIHQNYFKDPQYSGAQVFYSERNENSKLYAQNIQNCFQTYLQPENTRQIKAGGNIYLLKNTSVPAVLVECGFISNQKEAANLSEAFYRKQISLCIFEGIRTAISEKNDSNAWAVIQ